MPAEIDSHLRNLQLKTRHPVEHLLAGEYHSVFKGRSMEFDEIRSYTPGDDVRSIDWNVTARVGSPHIKRYIEERELAVWFLVDVSASCRTGHGPRTKQDVIEELTALLAFSAIRNHDRAGLMLFTDRVEHITQPRKGRLHAQALLSHVIHAQPGGSASDLGPALDALGHLARRRSLVFLISDFLFDLDHERLIQTGFRQDLIALAVNAPWEQSPPVCGLAAVADSETGDTMLCDFNARHQQRYARAFETRRAALKSDLDAAGADLIELGTESDCAQALTVFFRNRLRRMADETGG